MKWRRRLRVVGVLVAFAAAQSVIILIYRAVQDSRETSKQPPFSHEYVSIGLAPELQLQRPDGSKHALRGFRGKVVLLHFWATWCPPCRKELPALLELGRELSKRGQFKLVALSFDDEWSAIDDFFGGAIPPEVVREEGASASKAYGVSTLPDTYLIAPDGSLRLRFRGTREWRSERAREAILQMMVP